MVTLNLCIDESQIGRKRYANVKPLFGLSPSETMVYVLMAQGKPVSDIAKLVALSVKTVSTYRCRILEKLELNSNFEIIIHAIKKRIIIVPVEEEAPYP